MIAKKRNQARNILLKELCAKLEAFQRKVGNKLSKKNKQNILSESLLLKYREPNYTYSNSLKQCAICFDTTNHVSPFNCNKRCPICLDAFKLNSFISSSHCGILFHRHCISKWSIRLGKSSVKLFFTGFNNAVFVQFARKM